MFESAAGILGNPLYLVSYLLIVAVGLLGVLSRRSRNAVNARELVAEQAVDEDPQWLQAQATVLEALGALGFQRDGEVGDESRLLMERADLAVSVSWDARRRQVCAHLGAPPAGCRPRAKTGRGYPSESLHMSVATQGQGGSRHCSLGRAATGAYRIARYPHRLNPPQHYALRQAAHQPLEREEVASARGPSPSGLTIAEADKRSSESARRSHSI